MTDRFFRTPSSVIVLLIKRIEGKSYVLCQRRSHTVYAEGLYDFSCSGKVECGESMKASAIREAKEELGIEILPKDLNFLALEHKREGIDIVFYKGYFTVESFKGEPRICEPEKCSDLSWFDLDALPEDLIDENKIAAKLLISGGHYFEYGWES